jgi:hypothetical protein
MKHVPRIEKVVQGKVGEIALGALESGKIDLRLSLHGRLPIKSTREYELAEIQ